MSIHSIRELDAVVLARDLPKYGLRKGDLGAVVHVYSPDVLDVEFVRVSGGTHVLVQLERADIRALAESDLPAVRTG